MVVPMAPPERVLMERSARAGVVRSWKLSAETPELKVKPVGSVTVRVAPSRLSSVRVEGLEARVGAALTVTVCAAAGADANAAKARTRAARATGAASVANGKRAALPPRVRE